MSIPSARSNRRRASVILLKELREILRDRRTLLSVVIGPLVVTPGLFAVVGYSMQGRISKMRDATYTVALAGPPPASRTARALTSGSRLRFVAVTPASLDATVRGRKATIGLELPGDVDTAIERGATVRARVVTDPANQEALAATARLQARLAALGRDLVERRLRSRGLSADLAKPLDVQERALEGSRGAGALVLAELLPYILVLAAFTGAIYASFDQVAGEKERGTLETLLTSPATRRELVLGKFGAVVVVCIVSCVLSMVGLVIPFISGARVFAWLARGGVGISPASVAVIFAVIVPLSVLFAGLLLAVSTFSRNQKEAQTYLGSLFPIIMVPALFSIFVGADASLPVALVPVLNASIIIKQALMGTYHGAFILAAALASALYAGLALALATHLFQREDVLIKA